MIKRSLLFTSPGSIFIKDAQLKYEGKDGRSASIPIEDIGFVLIEDQHLQITTYTLSMLSEAGAVVALCDRHHLPATYILPATGHTLAHALLQSQVEASEALCGRLWRQTIQAKLHNQADAIASRDDDVATALHAMAKSVKNHDPDNLEAQGAHLYFSAFPASENPFHRVRDGNLLNKAMNYGYAILRAATARALVSSGLNCTFGIHHHNQYNSFCLADDIMEPYRPFVDLIVLDQAPEFLLAGDDLTPEIKRQLLCVLVMDTLIDGNKRPLMNALSCTTASLARCLTKEATEILYPEIAHG